MGSKSETPTTTKSENTLTDRRVVQQEGMQIIDSIMNDNSPAVIDAALKHHVAAFETMMRSDSLNLLELTSMGRSVLEMANKSQINISDKAQETLEAGLDSFEGMLKQGTLTLEIVDDITGRAFDSTDRALELVADVKTGDFADLSKTVMVFALVALYITTRNR